LENFWNYIKENPSKHGSLKASAVYILPENFGFGFRYDKDNIWGLWSADTDERAEKIWNDINTLIEKFGFSLDIVFSDPEYNDDLQWQYEEVIFWNEKID
jgi:hypothetical protein